MDIIRSFIEESSTLFQSSSVSPQTLVQKLYSDYETRTNNFDLPEYEWQTTPLPSDIKHIYIGELILSPIYLNASFQTKPKSQKSDPFFVMTFLSLKIKI